MELFDPIKNVENASAILDRGEWPNFHDAIVYSLNFWRGDMRPDDDIWIAPTIDASFELDALQEPYVVDIRFHSCDQIRMAHFDHNNDIYALSFAFVARGFLLMASRRFRRTLVSSSNRAPIKTHRLHSNVSASK